MARAKCLCKKNPLARQMDRSVDCVYDCPGLLIFSRPNHRFSKNQIVVISLFIVIGILMFIVAWFGSGDAVCLKDDRITDGAGRTANRSRYKDIECCNVTHDSYNDTKFSVLKFSVRKGLPVGQI